MRSLVRRKAILERRVFCIGLDGGTLDLIKLWIDDLPNFRKILTQGVGGKLKSTIPVDSIPAWPSFVTGRNPGKHGIFSFMEWEKRSHSLNWVDVKPLKEMEIWSLLSEANKTIVSLNVPLSYPPLKVNGYIVTGAFTPMGRNFTYPPELQSELEDIDYKIEFSDLDFSDLVLVTDEKFLKGLYYVTDKRAEATKLLMDRIFWHFFIVVFTEPDRIQHRMWEHIERSPQSNPIKDFYQRIDEIVGELLSKLDDDTILIIMSDHGFGLTRKLFQINEWLRRRGLLVLKRRGLALSRTPVDYSPWSSFRESRNLTAKHTWIKTLYSQLGKLLPKGKYMRNFGRRALIFLTSIVGASTDWSKTKASVSPLTRVIYLNANQGEYEQLRENIIKELKSLRYHKTGEKIFSKVLKKEEQYSGKYLAQAPDILLLPNKGWDIDLMLVHGDLFRDCPFIWGGHDEDGLFLMKGRDIVQGTTVNASIIDLFPTICHILDVPIPPDVDGRVLKEAFKPDSELWKRETKYGVPPTKRIEPIYWSDEETEELKEKLKRLGYL